jgi:salicylate hydroxylase
MIHLKKALKSLVDLGDSVQLNFEDGSEVHADLVVGADGIRSVGPISIIIGIPHLR